MMEGNKSVNINYGVYKELKKTIKFSHKFCILMGKQSTHDVDFKQEPIICHNKFFKILK